MVDETSKNINIFSLFYPLSLYKFMFVMKSYEKLSSLVTNWWIKFTRNVQAFVVFFE